MRNIYIFCLTTIFFLGLIKVNAQELSTYNLYMQNYYLYNPAYSFDKPGVDAYANSHLQWMGLDGAPKANSFGVHGPFNKTMGLGLSVVSEKHGLLSNFKGTVSYSYRAYFAEAHFLALGVSMGVIDDKLNADKIEGTNLNDPLLMKQSYNRTTFTANFGALYCFKNLEVQVIMPQLVERKKTNTYTLGIIAYNFQLSPMLKLKPSVLVRGAKISPGQFEGNILTEYNKLIWAEIGYRSSNSMIFGVGANFQNIKLGYAYQLDNGWLGQTSNGTHEIQLIYSFKKLNSNQKVKKIKETNVTGSVTNSANGTPVENADVIFYDNTGKEIYRTKTDKDGKYVSSLKPDENYKVEVKSEKFYSVSDMMPISATENSKTIDYKLETNTTILKGKVEPANSLIKIYDSDGKLFKTVQPDSNGNYAVEVENGKNYKIEVLADGFEPKTDNISIEKGAGEQNFSPTLNTYKDLTANIRNKDTNEPIDANIVVKNNEGAVIDNKSVKGSYSIRLLPGKYVIEVGGENIIPMKEQLEINKNTEKNYTLEIKAKVMSKDKTFQLGTVSFEGGKSIIKDQSSFAVLDELIKIMNENPEMKIEIGGHTDNVGNNALNLKLSQERANICKEYVVGKGISNERVKAVGYGKTKPILNNDTPENRSKNRRVEFKIL